MPPTTRSLFVAVLVALLAAASPAVGQEVTEPDPGFSPDAILFPVAGPNHYSDTWGAPRSGGRGHEGVDIMADKGIPVVAVSDGVVTWIGSECCYLAIDHGGGWETWYIHLNNDTPGTDDGIACVAPDAPSCGIAPGVVDGAPVTAGQVIGWVGDSGNAEESGSHLHFEIRSGGAAINPYPYVLAAEGGTSPEDVQPWWKGAFSDDEESVHQDDIDRIFERGLTKGCNPPDNTLYCPERQITRGEMAAFIRRLRDLPTSEIDHFADDDLSEFGEDIDAVTEAGIGFGCTEFEYCPDQPLLREEMAELLVRTFGYENPEALNRFDDDEGNRFEAAIDVLASVGVTKGCNPPQNTSFCPGRSLTRAEMASFFVRALDLEESEIGEPVVENQPIR